MIGLENMLYKVKTIKYNDDTSDYINDRLNHKTKKNTISTPKVIEKTTTHL